MPDFADHDDLCAATEALRRWVQSQQIADHDIFLVYVFEIVNMVADKWGEQKAMELEIGIKPLIEAYCGS